MTSDDVLLATVTLRADGDATEQSTLNITANALINTTDDQIQPRSETDGTFTVSGLPTGAYVTIADASASKNQTATAEIRAHNVEHLRGFAITLEYDPTVVVVIDEEINPTFGTNVSVIANNATGSVVLGSLSTSADVTSDDVLLATVTLRADGDVTNQSTLNITANSLINTTDAQIQPRCEIDGTFTVSLDTTPPAPTLSSTTGNYWVNHSWTAGSGGADTDSYYVCLNGAWTNGTTTTFKNTSVGESNWANITVWAYNTSCSGNLSSSSASANVQAPTAPNITSCTPKSPVTDSEGAARTFSVVVDQTATVTWNIGSTVVETDADTKTASYTKTNAQPGTWTVSAVATNANGTDTQTWVWTVIANGSISGTVTGSDTGAAVSGASVYVKSGGATIATATTGDAGTYLIPSIIPGTYTLNVAATGYKWNNATTAVVSAGTTNTSCSVVLTAQKVTLALQNGETASKIAVTNTAVMFNLTATNYGTNATIDVINSTTGATVTVSGVTSSGTHSIGLLNGSKNFNVTIVHTDAGYYPVTITVANTSQSKKSASIKLHAMMRNATGNTVLDGSTINTTSGANATDSFLKNASVISGATVNDSWLVNSNVSESATVIENSTVLNSSVSGIYSEVKNKATIDNSVVTNGTVDGATLVGVTMTGGSVTGTTIDTGHAVTLIGATVTAGSGGAPQITAGQIVTRGVNFAKVYKDTPLTELVIEQTADEVIPVNTLTSITGDAVGCDLAVNMTAVGSINITKAGINPGGEDTDVSRSTVMSKFIHIQCNDSTQVRNATIRIYCDASVSGYATVKVYYYNTTADPKAWEPLDTTPGTSSGRAYYEATPNHLSTFAVMGVTSDGGSSTSTGGGGGGTYPPGWFGTPTPTVTATKAPIATTTATDAPSGERVTPTPAKRPDATKTTTPTATETAKTDTPGLTAVFAIAGLLAVAYAMLRRRE